MKTTILLRRALAVLALLATCTAAQAQGGGWKYSLTPYLWLPNANGTLKYSPPPQVRRAVPAWRRDRTITCRTCPGC